MKIIAIGDFHGRFPNKFKTLIKKEKIDLIVSVGDYPPFYYRKLWFKHCFGKEEGLWEFIGKQKYKKIVLKDLKIGEQVLKKLNKLPIPTITVLGNIDYPDSNDVANFPKPKGKHFWEWDQKIKFIPILKKYKNIRRFDYSYTKFQDYIFIGMRGHSWPGKVKSKNFRKHKKILEKLFKKFSEQNKEHKVIFVSHTPTKDTKLDKLSKKTHPKVAGKHHGSKLTKRIIQKYQPILSIVGHNHEGFGKDKIKKSLVLNIGEAGKGQAIIITLQDNKKPKVKFIN